MLSILTKPLAFIIQFAYNKERRLNCEMYLCEKQTCPWFTLPEKSNLMRPTSSIIRIGPMKRMSIFLVPVPIKIGMATIMICG